MVKVSDEERQPVPTGQSAGGVASYYVFVVTSIRPLAAPLEKRGVVAA
jgi:hypothetical protein